MLRRHKIKRLGVTNKNKVVGIISASDVISVTPDLVDVISEKGSYCSRGDRTLCWKHFWILRRLWGMV